MTHTKKSKDKIRKARLGKHHSPETIAKIRSAMQERAEMVRQGYLPAFHHSEATKKKMRKSALHRKPSAKAIAASAAVRRKKAISRGKRFVEKDYAKWLDKVE